jgi:tRNA (adenine57-N1/adenine58-N1)-methyltransferase
LEQCVTLKIGDANEGFDERSVDAVFLDLREPWDALESAYAALRPGGVLGCIVPTANQLIEMSAALTRHPGFAMVEAEELLLRTYKVVPSRFRPEDQMVGHTGYLLFARAVLTNIQPIKSAAPGQDDET